MKRLLFLTSLILLGLTPSQSVWAEDTQIQVDESVKLDRTPQSEGGENSGETPRVVYPKKQNFDFDAMQIEGEVKNPGEFYFQVKPEDKMDSLVKRRKNFHRQMLRDVVLSK